MGDPRGFLKTKRQGCSYRLVAERVKDHLPVAKLRSDQLSKEQASRCLDCGTPFCHWGCPLGNIIPEWNDLLFNDHWERAYQMLESTNILPEVTGRVCPAPCESACVLGINDEPVTIRENELAIIEHAFKNDLVKPRLPKQRSGKKIAVVGSGPAGLACAVQLNRLGHFVEVLEKEAEIGGLMRYGIPDFKLDKSVLPRRQAVWQKEGVVFKTGVEVKGPLSGYAAVCLAQGCQQPRDLQVAGRDLPGIHFALEYLTQPIETTGKKVVVIGGGDTGADCVGTAHRRGAKSVVQIEIMPQPPLCRTPACPWPRHPLLFKTTSSHEEGGERMWSVMTKGFYRKEKDEEKVKEKVGKLQCIKVDAKLKEMPGSEFEIEADLVILALGFIKPEVTTEPGFFAAGDMRQGPSLIVKALADGRDTAFRIDKYLKKIK